LIIGYFPLTESGLKICLLRVRMPSSADNETKVISSLKEKAHLVTVLAQESLDQGKYMELVLEISIAATENLNDLLGKLSEISPDIKSQLLLR